MQTFEEAMEISKKFPGKVVVFDLEGNIEQVKAPEPIQKDIKGIPSNDSA